MTSVLFGQLFWYKKRNFIVNGVVFIRETGMQTGVYIYIYIYIHIGTHDIGIVNTAVSI